MKKLVGIILFLLALYGVLLLSDPGARSAQNHYNLGQRIGLTGVVSLGAGFLIIAGGIDLSIGSVVGLCATVCALLMSRLPPALAIAISLLLGAGIGLVNGLCVTKIRVQPFVVTLCGLFIYRGLARFISGDQVTSLGKDLPYWTEIKYWKEMLFEQDVAGLPRSLVILVILLALGTLFLHFSVYGRYLFAIGSNERAARYSGITTDRYKVLAYVLCSTAAALYAVLFLMKSNSVQPSTDVPFLELYAIGGAVLGGCSLRGGEGSVCGILVGTAILTLLPNLTNMLGTRDELEPIVIGLALLLGAILDEWLRIIDNWLRRRKSRS